MVKAPQFGAFVGLIETPDSFMSGYMGQNSLSHRAGRLFDLMQLLRDGQTHRAEDLALRFGVTVRTIYRDMTRLAASGVPVQGTRGAGYHLARETVLAPISLSDAELEVLNLGLAVLLEAGDSDLRATAESLAAKIDAAQPTQAAAEAETWKATFSPFADPARTLAHLPLLRSAIQARQKVALTYTDLDGGVSRQVVHPLRTTYMARSWILEAWSEARGAKAEFRLDLMDTVDPLPELFTEANT